MILAHAKNVSVWQARNAKIVENRIFIREKVRIITRYGQKLN